jgi:hypothetical protein
MGIYLAYIRIAKADNNVEVKFCQKSGNVFFAWFHIFLLGVNFNRVSNYEI